MALARRASCVATFFAALVAICGGVPTALAGGLEVPDLDPTAIGRGCAFTARADNLSAFYYNPAGLPKRKGPNLLLGSNIVNLNARYHRAGNGIDDAVEYDPSTPSGIAPEQDFSTGTAGEFGAVSLPLEHSFGPAPEIIFSWGGIGSADGLALSIGLITPSSFGAPEYPEDGAQRYAIRKASFLIVYPGIGVSYAFNRYIQIGAVFLSGIGIFEENLAIRPLPQMGDPNFNEDLEGDADLELEAKDYFMPTGILGVLSSPVDWLEIGLAVKLPTMIEAEGRILYTPPTGDLPESHLEVGHDDVTLSQQFPWVVRAGVRYIHRLFDIEVDFVFENWSSLDGFDIDLDAVLVDDTGPKDMPSSTVPKHFRDTYSVRLGGDVEVWPEHITLRAGGFFQSSAYPESNSTFSLDFPFGTQFGVGGGLTWHAARWLDVNAGYQHVFQLDVTVDEGVLQQQGMPLELPGIGTYQIGNYVNNGTYEVSLNMFGVSLEGHF